MIREKSSRKVVTPEDKDAILNCSKSKSGGGLTRTEINKLAKKYDIDPEDYPQKDELCYALLRVLYPETNVKSNRDIAKHLNLVAQKYEDDKEEYRARAFRNAAIIIGKLKQPLEDPITELSNISGIGQSVINSVMQYLSSNTTEESEIVESSKEKKKGEKISALSKFEEDLLRVYGFGKEKVKEITKMGINNFPDLLEGVNKGKVSLNDAQKVGLRYMMHLRERIPREEVSEVGEYILSVINEISTKNHGVIVGSYRRGLPTSGDIDILYYNDNNKNLLDDIIDTLEQDKFIIHSLAHGEKVFRGTYYSSYPKTDGILRRFDIKWVPVESLGTSLLHATGSDKFNTRIRAKANEMGYTLSEYGLTSLDTGEVIPTKTEEDVFKALDLDYVEPKDRN